MFRQKQQIELVTGLDIGSTAVRIALGQVTYSVNNPPELQLIAAVEVPSEGVHRGIVTSIEETVSSVSNTLEQLERLSGVQPEHVWVGISGSQIVSQMNRGVVAVAKSNGEIGPEDVDRVVSAAKNIALPLNYELVHVLPRTYTVDGQTGIKDPIGMTGIRLEVDTQIIMATSAQIKNLTRAIYRTGVDIDDLVLSALAAGDLVATPRQKDLGVAVVNLGGSTTSLIVYEEGDILHSTILPVGSEHITNDLAIGLRTSIDIAEKIKLQYGDCYPAGVNKKDVVDLIDVGNEVSDVVSRKYIAEIINARVEEIMEKIEKELSSIGRNGLLPAGIIYTGGGAKLRGLTELSKDKMRLPASLGFPIDVASATDRINDLAFTTAIGLVRWGANVNPAGKTVPGLKNFGKVSDQVKKWFKSLVP
ncbi:MAG TPA: cell division protein FtsA [Candidatus Magasanikbacteria bacterium]|nr:cell division protein FtsA [Candidatus Magasanikbacteria bacterium]